MKIELKPFALFALTFFAVFLIGCSVDKTVDSAGNDYDNRPEAFSSVGAASTGTRL